jgi:hypothetical protein
VQVHEIPSINRSKINYGKYKRLKSFKKDN